MKQISSWLPITSSLQLMRSKGHCKEHHNLPGWNHIFQDSLLGSNAFWWYQEVEYQHSIGEWRFLRRFEKLHDWTSRISSCYPSSQTWSRCSCHWLRQRIWHRVKEGLKRTTQWAAHYFTNKKSYYPVPSNSIRFWNISFLPPLPIVQMDEKDQERMKEWAHNNKKSVRQRPVRQETTRYKAATLNMYERKQTIGEKKYSLRSLLPMILMKPS